MKRFLVLITLFTALSGFAREWPYNESANAKAEIVQASADAQAAHRPVLLIFGANWCEDCRALDAALKQARMSQWLAAGFKVVKVDVGNFDRNLDVVAQYGNPIKNGIPAAVIVSPDHRVLYATRAGELANARKMSEDGIERFFKQALEQSGFAQ